MPDGRDRYRLDHCPFNPDHRGKDVAVFQGQDGKVGFKCFHNSCQGKGWQECKEAIGRPGPNYYDQPQGGRPTVPPSEPPKAIANVPATPGATVDRLPPVPPDGEQPWPKPLPEEAYHGLAGECVKVIEPASEADPAALLFQLLVAYGNAIGRSAYFAVEGDQHHANEFIALVGKTSKGRKGTSWGRVQQLFFGVDQPWLDGCRGHGLSSGEGLIWAVVIPSPPRSE